MHEIPKGWKVKKLGEICILDKGKIENCGELPYLEVKFLRNLKNADIKEKGIVVEKNQAVILVDGENSGEVFKVKTKGYLGSTFRILKLSDNVNFDYFIFFMNFVSLKFKNSKVGSAIPHLNKKLFNECEIPLPNLVEQKAIADKLDDSFAKIENAITNLINAKENLKLYKQSVLKSAFNGDLLPNTSPTHWEVKKLGEIFNVIGGGTPNTNNAEFWGGNISWISSADIDKENFNAIPRKFITENAIQNSATNLVPKNTIIVVTRVGLGKVAITKEPMCFSQDSQALIPFEKINVKFMAYQIKQIAQNFINISRGTTINGITKQNLKDCKICVPPLSEQNLIVAEIDRRFAIVDKTLNLIDKSIQNAKNLKQSILKKAFSGELRSEI